MFIAVSKCFKSTNFIDLWDQIRSNKSAGWKGASGQGPLLPSYSDFDPKCGNCCSPQKNAQRGGHYSYYSLKINHVLKLSQVSHNRTPSKRHQTSYMLLVLFYNYDDFFFRPKKFSSNCLKLQLQHVAAPKNRLANIQLPPWPKDCTPPPSQVSDSCTWSDLMDLMDLITGGP